MFLSITELKVKFVRWLLSSQAVRDELREHLVEDVRFARDVYEMAERAAEEAIEEMDEPVHAEDVDGLELEIENAVDRVLTEEIEKKIEEKIEDICVDAEDVEGLEKFIETTVEKITRERFALTQSMSII